jgi:hypothetical protein
MRWTFAASALALGVFGTGGFSDEPKDKETIKSPLVLKLVAKKTTYTWDAGGKTPAEFKKQLQEIAEAIKSGKGFDIKPPPSPAVEMTLQITNTGKDAITIHVGGDSNIYTLELKGPGTFALNNPVAVTADFRLPRATTLEAGKSYEVPLRNLMDGHRGISRLVYWTEPGDYTLSVSYQLASEGGEKTALLKSAPIKLKVEKGK